MKMGPTGTIMPFNECLLYMIILAKLVYIILVGRLNKIRFSFQLRVDSNTVQVKVENL